jgi:hypothetical protein
MGAENTSFLFHSRWLPGEKVLTRIFELRGVIYTHLLEKRHSSARMFVNCDFNIQLAYVKDIFDKLESLSHCW